MASITKRRYADGRALFRVRIRRHGILVSRQFSSAEAAEAFARATEADLTGRAPAEAMTLSALIDQYRPRAPTSYGGECLDYWRAKLGHLRLGEVTPAIVRAHRDELARTPARSHGQKTARTRAPATTRKYLIVLGSVFQYAIRELNFALANPARLVTKPKAGKHRVRYLTADERARLLAEARASRNKRLYAAVLFSLTSGARRGETAALLWEDVDLDAGLALLRDTKNGETRGAVLTPEVVAAFQAICPPESPPIGRVFPTGLSSAFREATSRARLNIRWHDMRHDAGSRLAAAGVSTRLIMEVLGHKTLSMATVYQHVTASAVRAEVLRVMEEKAG